MQGILVLTVKIFVLSLFFSPISLYAQTASQILEDVDIFRSALGDVYGIVRISPNEEYRFERQETGLLLTDQNKQTILWDINSSEMRLCLVGLLLSDLPMEEVFSQLSVSFRVEQEGIGVLDDGSTFIHRIGDLEGSWIALEVGTSRPWRYNIPIEEVFFEIRIESYSEEASGWFPDRIRVLEDGQTTMNIAFERLVEEASLVPTPESWIPRPVYVHFPWLPL